MPPSHNRFFRARHAGGLFLGEAPQKAAKNATCSVIFSFSGRKTKKKTRSRERSGFVTEKEGFEPSHRY